MLSIDDILAGVQRIKDERAAAVQERDNALLDRDDVKARLDSVKNLLTNEGDGLTLTKLPSFLKSLRALIEESKS